MGDFSRSPAARLQDSVSKHYVGVRMQQGVPILDADWNELEDLRRHELESVGTWFLGNGVPVGSDGFRISPVDSNGVDTIVLSSSSSTVGLSIIEIDIPNSTAASVLGFDSSNSLAERFGDSPAQLAGNRSEPFNLGEGSTLVAQSEAGISETVTFQSGDFADISAATADEIVAAINGVLGTVVASKGDGNDFYILGGNSAAQQTGIILVEGRQIINDKTLRYTEQSLFNNNALAAQWGVLPVDPLSTPAVDTQYAVYLDVWHREVNSSEDDALVDVAVGVETAARLRREWAVRVTPAVDFQQVLANKPDGHVFYILAHLDRQAGNAAIGDSLIADERATEMSLRPEVAYRGLDGQVLVDSAEFLDMLIQLRDVIRDFIAFLTARFVDPNQPYLAGEVAGIDSLSAIASIADRGITLLHAQSLSTRGAIDFFSQLLDAEIRFVDTWQNAMLPLIKPGGRVYEQAYEQLVDTVALYLTGPAPSPFVALSETLSSRNLELAVRTQEQIITEFGGEVDRPSGVLFADYIGSPASTIQPNISFNLEFEITGSVTPEDKMEVEVFIDPAWETTLLNEDGSVPFDVSMGPGDDIERFQVRVLPPDDASAVTQIGLQVNARRNPAGLSHNTSLLTLSVGQPPPGSQSDFTFIILNANVIPVRGVYQVPASTTATFTYQLSNNTSDTLNLEFEFDPATDPDWTIIPSFSQTDNILANTSKEYTLSFQSPGVIDVPLISTLIARNSDNGEIAAQITVSLITIS